MSIGRDGKGRFTTGNPGGPRKFRTAEDLREKIEAYFAACDEKGEPYTVTGMAVALDTWKEVLHDYETGKYDDEENPYSRHMKKAKQRIEADMERGASTGKRHPIFAMFALKNHYGWRDKQEIELNATVHTVEQLLDDID